MSEDWLDTSPAVETAGLPAVITIPEEYTARLALVEQCWQRLSSEQRVFLDAWRVCNCNSARTARYLGKTNAKAHSVWMRGHDYATVAKVWRANVAAGALDRDRLLARHDDIAETALTPKPVLYQGVMVLDTRPGARPGAVLEEVDVGAARSANADLLQAAGVLKSGKDVEVNVGVAVSNGPPTLNIQVLPKRTKAAEQSESVVIDAKFIEVPSDDEWLSA